ALCRDLPGQARPCRDPRRHPPRASGLAGRPWRRAVRRAADRGRRPHRLAGGDRGGGSGGGESLGRDRPLCGGGCVRGGRGDRVEEGDRMRLWLFKSEPDVFCWDDLVAKGAAGEEWDGVRSYQARNFMREMRLGDRGFFYHSNIGKEIVGIVEVSAEAHPDSTADDPKWECVDVRAVEKLPRPVPLATIKTD